MSHQKNACAARLLSKAALSLVAIALLTLPATAQLFQITNLTSDISSVGVNPTDPDLVNPWGMSLVAAARGGFRTTEPANPRCTMGTE